MVSVDVKHRVYLLRRGGWSVTRNSCPVCVSNNYKVSLIMTPLTHSRLTWFWHSLVSHRILSVYCVCIPYIYIINTKSYCEHSFFYIAPTFWIILPKEIIDSLCQPLPSNQHVKLTFSQHVCVCAHACVCVRACVYVRSCACVCVCVVIVCVVCVCVCVHVCERERPITQQDKTVGTWIVNTHKSVSCFRGFLLFTRIS